MLTARERTGSPGSGPREEAQTAALAALAYVLADADRAGRFLAATGLDGTVLAGHLGDHAFLGGVLDFVLEDEVLLLGAAEAAGQRPERLVVLRQRLPGAMPRD